jgi:hypothetical protein
LTNWAFWIPERYDKEEQTDRYLHYVRASPRNLICPFDKGEAIPTPEGYETAQLVPELRHGADEAAAHPRRRNFADVQVDCDCDYPKRDTAMILRH